MTKDEIKNRISMALKDPILQQGFEIICKENAELKSLKDVAELIRLNNSHIVAMAQLNNNNVALRKENAELKLKLEALDGQTPWKDIKDKSEVIEQFTKAKELLKRCYENYIYLEPLRSEIEQFLNSEEK